MMIPFHDFIRIINPNKPQTKTPQPIKTIPLQKNHHRPTQKSPTTPTNSYTLSINTPPAYNSLLSTSLKATPSRCMPLFSHSGAPVPNIKPGGDRAGIYKNKPEILHTHSQNEYLTQKSPRKPLHKSANNTKSRQNRAPAYQINPLFTKIATIQISNITHSTPKTAI